MNYKILLISLFFFISCAPIDKFNSTDQLFSSKGFLYIYNDDDYDNKIVSKKFLNEEEQISHTYLKIGTNIKITNPKNNKSIILKVNKRSTYPEFYKLLITQRVAKKIELSNKVPFAEIIQIKKNKIFVAKKAKTFKEETKIHSKAPVTGVKIDNISKNKKTKKTPKINKFSILIAEFYSKDSAGLLKNKLNKELNFPHGSKLSIRKKNINNYQLILGGYNAINLLKNDYIMLINYGFESLEINLHE